MNKCLKCGFQPLETVECPACGFEVMNENDHLENVEQEVESTDQQVVSEDKKNDDIQWENLKDVSLEDVMSHLTEFNEEKDVEEDRVANDVISDPSNQVLIEEEKVVYEDNPILKAYIQAHKEGRQLEFQEILSELMQQKQEEIELNEEESSSRTDTSEDDKSQLLELVEEDLEIKESSEQEMVLSKEELAESTSEVVLPEEMSEEVTLDKEASVLNQEKECLQVSEDSLIEESNLEESEPKKKSKKKWIYSAVSLSVLCLAGGSAYYVHAQQVAQEEKAIADAKRGLNQVKEQLSALFLSKNQQFLKQTTTLESIQTLESRLEKFKRVDGYVQVLNLLNHSKDLIEKQTDINQKFTQPILIENHLQNDAHVKDVFNTVLYPVVGTGEFLTLYNQAISKGQQEIVEAKAIIVEADNLVSKLQNNSLDASVTQEQYNATMNKVNQLHVDTLKTEYLKKIEPIKAALDKKAADEKAAKDQADKVAAEQARAAQLAAQAAKEQADREAVLRAAEQAVVTNPN